MKSVVGSVEYDSRDDYVRTGWAGCGFFEFSGGGLGGDYSFRKYAVELAHYARLSETQTLNLVARWGVGSGTDYPSHKLFYLGGPGDLRGYDYKTFSGKNMMFARAEYGIDVWPHLRTIFFVDTGSVWYGGGDISQEFSHDFGIGFRSDSPGVGDIRIDIARAATTDEADIFVYFDLYF
jgi:outer membrane protein assembly factor BamA